MACVAVFSAMSVGYRVGLKQPAILFLELLVNQYAYWLHRHLTFLWAFGYDLVGINVSLAVVVMPFDVLIIGCFGNSNFHNIKFIERIA